MNKKNPKYQDSDKTSEPKSPHKNIWVFNSISEAETARIQKTIKQTPEERLSETVNLIRRVYNLKIERDCKQTPENKIRWKFRP